MTGSPWPRPWRPSWRSHQSRHCRAWSPVDKWYCPLSLLCPGPEYLLHLCFPLNKRMRTRAWENWSLHGSPGMSYWVRPLEPRMNLKVDVIFKFQGSFKSLDWMWWRHRPRIPLTGMLIQTEVCAFRDCRRLWWACSLVSERPDRGSSCLLLERKRRSQRLWVILLGHWGLCQGGLEVTSPSSFWFPCSHHSQ